MTDLDVHGLLAQAAPASGGGPAPDLVTPAVARLRRRTRHRRAAQGAVAVTAVLAAVVYAGLPASGSRPVPGATGAGAGSATTADAVAVADVRRMESMRHALAKALPPGSTPLSLGAEERSTDPHAGLSFRASYLVRSAGRTTGLAVQVVPWDREYTGLVLGSTACEPPAWRLSASACEVRAFQDGRVMDGRVMVYTGMAGGLSGVTVVRHDGVAVIVDPVRTGFVDAKGHLTFDVNKAALGPDGRARTRSTGAAAPLTPDQLVRLATDPGVLRVAEQVAAELAGRS